jgi:hypothetical protein
MPKSKREAKGSIYYARAESIEDIARRACKFDYTSDLLLLNRTAKGNELISFGGRIKDTILAYYVNVKESGRIIRYAPASEGAAEKAEFVPSMRADATNGYYINVMKADLGGFSRSKGIDAKSVELIGVDSALDLVSAVIKKTSKEESAFAHVYAFPFKGRRILAAFDLVNSLSNDRPAFFFAPFEGKTRSFARYDYREDRLDFTDTIGEHAYLYAKVINLAEPFPFFRRRK